MVAESRGRLGEEAFAAAWLAGQRLTLDEAVAEARALPRCGESLPYGLTQRELRVLRLLVEGRSDKEIAAALRITRRTASQYVSAILAKLGAPSRTAAAILAVRRGLV